MEFGLHPTANGDVDILFSSLYVLYKTELTSSCHDKQHSKLHQNSMKIRGIPILINFFFLVFISAAHTGEELPPLEVHT